MTLRHGWQNVRTNVLCDGCHSWNFSVARVSAEEASLRGVHRQKETRADPFRP